MNGSTKVLLVAGEASGDLHGAAFVRALGERVPAIEVAGIGGAQLRAAGMRILVDSEHVATMGLTETLGTIGGVLSGYRRILRFLDAERPALVVLIDYPEFNLLVARQAKKRGIPVFYFIGPQVWAWRKGRVKKIVARVDKMALVFPFEPALYNAERSGTAEPFAEFVGHPLLDVVRTTRPPGETRGLYGLDPRRPVLALLPGSRRKEIEALLGPMNDAAATLAAEGWQPVLALAPNLEREHVEGLLAGRRSAFAIARGDTYNVVAAADAAVVASGTATLEAALLGCPLVVVYRVSALTYFVARRLVRIDWIGMPNILLGEEAFPELIQDAVTPQAIVAKVRDVHARRADLARAAARIRDRLGAPGAAGRAADLAVALLRRSGRVEPPRADAVLPSSTNRVPRATNQP